MILVQNIRRQMNTKKKEGNYIKHQISGNYGRVREKKKKRGIYYG